jgi:hypothetical protein
MTEIRVAQRLAGPAEAVWALIGDFGGLQRWHPRVSRLDLSWEGRIRTIHFDDGGHAVERLDARNDLARRYAYVVVDSSLPMQSCRGTLQVAGDGGDSGSVVTWSSEFEPVGDSETATVSALRGLYADGLAALAGSF